jgi:hypothetical protein
MKSVIHVNSHKIRENNKTGKRQAVITIKNYKGNHYGHEVVIKGPAKVVYRPDKPLSCGAVCWISTQSDIEIIR